MKRLVPVCVMILCLCTASVPANAEGPLGWLFGLLAGISQNGAKAGMTHAETVEAFRALGIDVPEETVREAEQSVTRMLERFSDEEQPWDFPLMLLGHLGVGEYDFDTGTWTATSSDVYAFDAEIFDIEHMYTLFLQGVSSIVPGFVFTGVTEVIVEWDEEEAGRQTGAEGTTLVRFTLNGRAYERKLNFYGDWFDTAAIDWINEVLRAEGFEGQLCAFSDGGQGLILFYGDEGRIERLKSVIPQPPWAF